MKAPQGPLRSLARVVPEKDGEQVREVLTWNDDIDPTVTIDFPSIIQHDTKEAISAIIDAQTLAGRSEGAGIPLETAVRRLVSELGINDVDAVMEIWQQAQAERRARADEMAARMSSSPTPAANDARADGEDQPSDDVPGSNDAMEAWQRMTSTAETLLTELRESVNGNGQQA